MIKLNPKRNSWLLCIAYQAWQVKRRCRFFWKLNWFYAGSETSNPPKDKMWNSWFKWLCCSSFGKSEEKLSFSPFPQPSFPPPPRFIRLGMGFLLFHTESFCSSLQIALYLALITAQCPATPVNGLFKQGTWKVRSYGWHKMEKCFHSNCWKTLDSKTFRRQINHFSKQQTSLDHDTGRTDQCVVSEGKRPPPNPKK